MLVCMDILEFYWVCLITGTYKDDNFQHPTGCFVAIGILASLSLVADKICFIREYSCLSIT